MDWSLREFIADTLDIHVLDVGAAMYKDPPYQPLIDAGCARVMGFEPNLEACEALNARYGSPHYFFPYYVGDGGPATFHETNWNLTGSLYEPNTPLLEIFQNIAEHTRPVAQHAVHTTRLDDIQEIDDVDFFKIDVQGSELPIFQHATRLLAKTVVIQTEVEFVPLYKQQPLFADVDAFLRSQGFQFHTFDVLAGRAFKPLVPNGDPNQSVRQCLWADAIYVRDWMHLDRLSPAKLRHYAVLAHDIVQSHDLAHFVLRALDRMTGSAIAPVYLAKLTAPA